MSFPRIPTGVKRGWMRLCFVVLCAGCLCPFAVVGSDPAPPPAPARRDVLAALAPAPALGPGQRVPPPRLSRKLRVLLLADKKDHGAEEHDYPLWQERWALWLGGKTASDAAQINLFGPRVPEPEVASGVEGLTVTRAQNWPTPAQFAAADVMVAFCYLPWNAANHAELARFLDHGGGLVLIHSATWTMPGPDEEVAKLTGVGGFTKYRHGPIELKIAAPDDPICRGLPARLHFYDETYWPPTPAVENTHFRTLAASEEAAEPTGNPVAQPIFWTWQPGIGKVFGCVLGHYTWTFDDPWFRVWVLRGVAWAGGQPANCLDGLVLRGARVAESER